MANRSNCGSWRGRRRGPGTPPRVVALALALGLGLGTVPGFAPAPAVAAAENAAADEHPAADDCFEAEALTAPDQLTASTLTIRCGPSVPIAPYAYHNPTSFSDPAGRTPGCPPQYCRGRQPTPTLQQNGCPPQWCKINGPPKPNRPQHSTVTYPNGTSVTEFHNGPTAINGFVLGADHPDPQELALWIDDQMGTDYPAHAWLTEPLSDDPTKATAQMIEARCRLSRLDWDDFCSVEYHSTVREKLGYDRGGSVAICYSTGAYLGILGGTVRDCIALGSEGIAVVAIVAGGPSTTRAEWPIRRRPRRARHLCIRRSTVRVDLGGGGRIAASCIITKPLVTW